MSDPSHIRGVIFDFGDVICFWNKDGMGEARSLSLGLPKETIGNLIWDYLRAAGDGTYHSVQDYFERLDPPAPVGVDIVAEAYAEMENSAVVDQRMVELIISLKPRYKIGLLSNFPKGIEDYMAGKFQIGQLFDAVVSSYNIGKKKPSPDAYLYAARQIGLEPSACLFVDDSENNVRAAVDTGMSGLVYGGFDDFVRQMEITLGNVKE